MRGSVLNGNDWGQWITSGWKSTLSTQRLPQQDATLKYHCLLVNDEFTAMGRVSVISHAAAFLAGYNLRLLTVVQAMSQLDAVYGEKEARTFATNHGLQILYAPREQRDADEYSAMLGQYTEQVASRGRSRSFGRHTSSSVSRNESEQRRALLLPQEFKELGAERLVVILENCKPILAEKIRYHREKTFTARLQPAPAVPRMNMDLHLAKVQQRWRYAADELAPGDGLSVEQLAMALDGFEVPKGELSAVQIDSVVDEFFCLTHTHEEVATPFGGTIEPAEGDPLVDPSDESSDALPSTGPSLAEQADEDGVLPDPPVPTAGDGGVTLDLDRDITYEGSRP